MISSDTCTAFESIHVLYAFHKLPEWFLIFRQEEKIQNTLRIFPAISW